MSAATPDMRLLALHHTADVLRWSVAALLADFPPSDRVALLTRWRDTADRALGEADPANWPQVQGLRLVHTMAEKGLHAAGSVQP